MLDGNKVFQQATELHFRCLGCRNNGGEKKQKNSGVLNVNNFNFNPVVSYESIFRDVNKFTK
jgi:hypothetical protein